MPRRPTDADLRDELDRIFEALEQWKALDRDTQLQAFGCQSCKVRVGEPCKGKRGAHAPRIDARLAALNSAPVEGWRRDLADGYDPAQILQKVKRAKLYRAGKLTALLQPRRALCTAPSKPPADRTNAPQPVESCAALGSSPHACKADYFHGTPADYEPAD